VSVEVDVVGDGGGGFVVGGFGVIDRRVVVGEEVDEKTAQRFSRSRGVILEYGAVAVFFIGRLGFGGNVMERG